MHIYHFVKLNHEDTRYGINKPFTWGLCTPWSHGWGGPAYFYEYQANDYVKILKNNGLPAYVYSIEKTPRKFNSSEFNYRVCITFENKEDEAEFVLRASGGLTFNSEIL